MFVDAVFSPDRVYRYALRRMWDSSSPIVLFVGLNPSTADESKDDPTIRRCVGFARRWGFGGIWMTNLFAYRATHPRELRRVADPVGPENDEWILRSQEECTLVVAAWGNGGRYRNRVGAVLPLLKNSHCLAVNQSGQPAHPLFLRGDIMPTRFSFFLEDTPSPDAPSPDAPSPLAHLSHPPHWAC